MLLLSHLVDISPKSHYMSNSFIRYEFDSKETALECFKELEGGKYSSVDRARDVISSLTSYGVVATTYNTTRGSGTFCVEASEVIESFLYWYYKSESTKGVKRCCIDSELYKYVTITGIIFKNLCFGNTSDLQIDVVCSINSGDDSKVRDLVDTLNTPMNMFAHINSGSLIISLLLKS